MKRKSASCSTRHIMLSLTILKKYLPSSLDVFYETLNCYHSYVLLGLSLSVKSRVAISKVKMSSEKSSLKIANYVGSLVTMKFPGVAV